MYDVFHAHLFEINVKTQESNMHGLHGKLRRSYLEIYKEETYKKSRSTEFTLVRSVKDVDSTTTWKALCCFAFIMKSVFYHSKEYKKGNKTPEGFQQLIQCSHLSIIQDENLEADLQLSCISQMSMLVIFMPCIDKSPI